MSDKKIIISGSTGFIGNNLVPALMKKNYYFLVDIHLKIKTNLCFLILKMNLYQFLKF